MKEISIRSRLVCFAIWSWLCASAIAQGNPEFVPNTITGTLTFNNASPVLLDLLNDPTNEGMSNLFIYADSIPAERSSVSPLQATASRVAGNYTVTVDSTTNGVTYRVAPVAVVAGGAQYYWFTPQTSPPVVTGAAGPVMDFTECVGVLQLNFFTSDGIPAIVNTVQVNASRTLDGSASATYSSNPADSTARVFVEGGKEHQLNITLFRGSDPYLDRQVHFLITNVTAVCNAIVGVDIYFPPEETFATVIGQVDMLREFEWWVDGNDIYPLPDYTTVIANYGPYQNERWAVLPGDNIAMASSGEFNLVNLTPSSIDPASSGYALQANMLFRPNRMVQYFRTPGLGWGTNNPALPVEAGASLDLTNLFVIDPGYVRGQILLQGPAGVGARSPLRELLHAGDSDDDSDGIPDYVGTYGVYYSTVGADGVDRKAAGADFSAANGFGYGDFDGSFDEAANAYRGNYELALGGLLGQSSVWKRNQLTIVLSSGTVANEDDYYYNVFSIFDRRAAEIEITPGIPVTSDIAYCLSEVLIRFRSTNSIFYSPQVRFEGASFVGTDFQLNAADYGIGAGIASGTPLNKSDATNTGRVLLYLPQGQYTLMPGVIPGDADGGLTGLEPIPLTVGCGQTIILEPCLQMSLAIPPCHAAGELTLTGSVRSCGNAVSRISYELNGGGAVTLCEDCGADPNVSFAIALVPGTNTISVTASDGAGGFTSVSGIIRSDDLPPIIQCPADITIDSDRESEVVSYSVTATDDGDPSPVIICVPPSGSEFLPGETIVNCTATDAAGLQSSCTFKVTIAGCLRVEFEPPTCTTNFGFLARATVFACSAILTNLSMSSYSLVEPTARLGYSDIRILEPAGLARTNLSTAHGLFPDFDSFPRAYYADILYTVTARANDGRTAVRQYVAHYDLTPPAIDCADVSLTSTNGTDAIATFSATDDQPGAVILNCTPPSGSAFPVGTTPVTCTARDLCQNTNTCSFQVIVRSPGCPLHIELTSLTPATITMTWSCPGTLQGASTIDGPWTDIPEAASPYVIASGDPQMFYRLKTGQTNSLRK